MIQTHVFNFVIMLSTLNVCHMYVQVSESFVKAILNY